MRDKRMLRIIERSLRLDKYWYDFAPPPPPYTLRWSHRNLNILARVEFSCSSRIDLVSRRLPSIDRRQLEAGAHCCRAAALIRGEAG